MKNEIDIQKNLRALLKKHGVLHKQVAAALGMTSQGLSNWFTRKDDLSFSQITRICEVAKISIVDVVTFPEEYVPKKSENPICEECKRKDEIIDNLNELLRKYKIELKKYKSMS